MKRRSLLKKQTVKASQDRCKIPSRWNNLFQDKQIICLRQADYMQRNSLLIKVQVLNRLFTKKIRNLNGNTFSFIPHVCYFSYHPWIVSSEDQSLQYISLPK